MDEILGQVLRNAVWERLDMLSELANRADAPSLLSVARSELPRLTEGWRAMLAAHEPDDRGNCPACSSRWRQQKAPCSVWQAAYEHLVAGGLAPDQNQARHAIAEPRPRARVARQAGERQVRPATSAPVTPHGAWPTGRL